MKAAFLVLAVFSLAVTWPAASAADEFYYEVTDYGGTPATIAGSCTYVEHPAPGLGLALPYTMKGYFVFDQPVSSVTFSLPAEELVDRTCPGAVVSSTTFEFPWSGDPDYYSVVVDFGGCVTGVVHVFTRTIVITDHCALGGIFPPQGVIFPNDPMSVGCDAVERVVADLSGCTAPPQNVMPPDGATDVSVNPTMTCIWASPQHCPEGTGLVIYSVHLGTDPDDLEFVRWQDYGEVQIGPLLPSTTYYWRMRVWDDFWNCPGNEAAWSPLMSFTTAAPVETEARTWGRVKADYRKPE